MSDRRHVVVSAEAAGGEKDSAATTLLPSADSSRKLSHDGMSYADVELQEHYARDRRDARHGNHEAQDFLDDAGEDEHLLARETAIFSQPQAATATQPDDGEPPPPPVKEKDKPVSWSSLPKKGQLAILTLARLSEPLTQTSLQSYMFYQLKSFTLPSGEAPSDSTVARQAGLLAAAFTGAQFMTAIMWGRLADWEGLGRKKVILIGLLGTAIGSLGFGFSGSFASAVFWRCVGGMLNGNMGVMRTMISEIVKEKKYQSRAFLLLPMTFNIGVIVGPLLGGLLADPVGTYPRIFGPDGSIGGREGVRWMMKYPYALPNVINACFLTLSALGLVFGLEETLESLRDKPDYALRFRRWVFSMVFGRQDHGYSAIPDQEPGHDDVEMQSAEAGTRQAEKPRVRRKLSFRRIWTRNVLVTFLAHGLLAMHVGTFNNLWFVFLSTPRYNPLPSQKTSHRVSSGLRLPEDYHPHAPFTFTGGLAFPPPTIGTALAILGVIGISMQLLLFPRVSFRLGTTRSFHSSLLLFPIAYFLAPYLSVVPSWSAAPKAASGPFIWVAITLVLLVQVTARTFALPSTAILVNNCCPHPSVLGTVHGMAQSVSSATRTVGPVLAGWIYGIGLNRGTVGLAWWCMSGVALVGALAGRLVKEGDGHEIWLEGEREEQEAQRQAG